MAAYYNENNKYCTRWLRNLIQEGLICPGIVDDRPIQEVKPSDLLGFLQCHFFAGLGGWSYALRLASWPDNLRVWTGSCPCQPFSIAGKQLATKDKRHLWPHFHRLIKECKPTVIFGEQVAGNLAVKWFSRVRFDLESSGYSVGAANLCAFSCNKVYRRQRLYFVAYPCTTRLQDRRDAKTLKKDETKIPKRTGLSVFFENVVPTYEWLNKPLLGRRVHGVPSRVDQVCAFGNAINPQIASKFIKAAM